MRLNTVRSTSPSGASDTNNSSDKPQLPRCTVSLSKSRQYCWQFCTLRSLWFCEMRFCATMYLQKHQDIQRTHTCAWEHLLLYIPSKLYFVSHTLTLTPNNAVPGFWLQKNVWCGQKFFTSVYWTRAAPVLWPVKGICLKVWADLNVPGDDEVKVAVKRAGGLF